MMAFKKLNRQTLPFPSDYLAKNGLLNRYPKGKWVSITCPAHKEGKEKNPSMGVNLDSGHFICHACGEKGGDIVALHMLRTRLKFLDAVIDLGGTFYD